MWVSPHSGQHRHRGSGSLGPAHCARADRDGHAHPFLRVTGKLLKSPASLGTRQWRRRPGFVQWRGLGRVPGVPVWGHRSGAAGGHGGPGVESTRPDRTRGTCRSSPKRFADSFQCLAGLTRPRSRWQPSHFSCQSAPNHRVAPSRPSRLPECTRRLRQVLESFARLRKARILTVNIYGSN